ncbi:MAG: hypothetical protein GY716_20500 [bacterium]|nr:hypothetical protein [bacterium]
MAEGFEKQQWVDLFREIGLSEDTMREWHAAFEKSWPQTHQSFLEWLKVPESDIDRIRRSSRSDWARS